MEKEGELGHEKRISITSIMPFHIQIVEKISTIVQDCFCIPLYLACGGHDAAVRDEDKSNPNAIKPLQAYIKAQGAILLDGVLNDLLVAAIWL